MAADTNLPEGTDKIIDTATAVEPGSSVRVEKTAPGSGGDTGDVKGAVGKAAESLKESVREQVSTLKSQATERAHGFADTGKGQATDLLQNIAAIVREASESVETRLGDKYSGVGFKAADQVNNFAGTLNDRSVEELLDDAKAFVKRSPAVAIGIAAVVGFAVARVVRSSLDELNASRDGANGNQAD